jgi:opacity protein-like surface antigen
MKRLLIAVALLATTASASLAGSSYLGLQLAHGTADLTGEFGSGFASAYDHSELGFKLEYWNMLSEDYAFNGSYSMGYFREENKPGTNAPSGAGQFTYSQSSWSVRLGGDRVVGLGDRTHLYFGPGVEYWTGKAKFEDDTSPASSYETESVSRISLSCRLGAHMMIGEGWGLTVQAGHKIGRASYSEAGAESTWWPSSLDASGGLVFRFGGD